MIFFNRSAELTRKAADDITDDRCDRIASAATTA